MIFLSYNPQTFKPYNLKIVDELLGTSRREVELRVVDYPDGSLFSVL